MFNFLKNIFNKNNADAMRTQETPKSYLSCRYLHGGVTFMHQAVRTCCSHKLGVTFVDNYKGEEIDWQAVAKQRKAVIEDCKRGILPDNCKGCVDLETKVWEENKLIDDIYINHWDHCNCGCVYCVAGQSLFLQTEMQPGRYYNVYNHLEYLYKHGMVSKNAHIELVGGDLTILDEADKIINLCLDNGVGRMSFHSSCIYYSQGIERALKEAPSVDFDFSIDCGDRELYKKIKRIDALDSVVENVKRYLACSERAKDALIAKYIIVDGLNDSVEEVDKWLRLIHCLGITHTKIDINFKRFFPEFHHSDPTVPAHYYEIYKHYKKRVEEWGLIDCCWEFSRRVMEEGGIPKGYVQS